MSIPVTLDIFESYLRDLSHAELIVEVETIAMLGEQHPGLQDVPDDVPGPKVLMELKVDFAASVQAAAYKDKLKVEERDAKRLHLLECVVMWGQHIVMRYKRRNDASVLHNNGFALKKPQVKTSASKAPTPVPSDVRVKHAAESGGLQINVKFIHGNGTFEVRFTSNPNDDSSWVDGGHHTYCQFELKGFVPGTKYYFSLRYHGANGTSAWSNPVSIIAL
jgi:hypothetical protein